MCLCVCVRVCVLCVSAQTSLPSCMLMQSAGGRERRRGCETGVGHGRKEEMKEEEVSGVQKKKDNPCSAVSMTTVTSLVEPFGGFLKNVQRMRIKFVCVCV